MISLSSVLIERYEASLKVSPRIVDQFLLVFNEGLFSEDNTFLLSEWIAHTPSLALSKNLRKCDFQDVEIGCVVAGECSRGSTDRIDNSRLDGNQ